MTQPTELTTLLDGLATAGVDFVLVGGLAAVSQGAPLATFDVDIVHDIDDANIDRLLAFLRGVNARHRRPDKQVVAPSAADLRAGGYVLLMTDLGPLDVLGTIEQGLRYAELLPRSIEVTLRGRAIRVLALSFIVELKRESTHEKDRLALPVLEATLARARKVDIGDVSDDGDA